MIPLNEIGIIAALLIEDQLKIINFGFLWSDVKFTTYNIAGVESHIAYLSL